MSRPTSLPFSRLACCTLAVAALLGAMAPVGAEPPAAARKYALLVGVNEYTNRKFDNLKYAERDVLELAKELRAAGYEVRVLSSGAAGKDQATRAKIEAAVDEVLKKVTKKDIVLVALAGHGVQFKPAEKEDAFFCPRDAVLGKAETLVSLSWLFKELDDRGGKDNLVLVDACRNDPDPARGRGIDGGAPWRSRRARRFSSVVRGGNARMRRKRRGRGTVFSSISCWRGCAARRRRCRAAP